MTAPARRATFSCMTQKIFRELPAQSQMSRGRFTQQTLTRLAGSAGAALVTNAQSGTAQAATKSRKLASPAKQILAPWDKLEKSLVTIAAIAPQSLMFLPLWVAGQLGTSAQWGLSLQMKD
jgi:hypothetical protein